jgi:hypothetical protein
MSALTRCFAYLAERFVDCEIAVFSEPDNFDDAFVEIVRAKANEGRRE